MPLRQWPRMKRGGPASSVFSISSASLSSLRLASEFMQAAAVINSARCQ